MKIYEQKSIQKIIDFHFTISRWYFELMFAIHILFFIVPIFMIIFVPQNETVQEVACIIALAS